LQVQDSAANILFHCEISVQYGAAALTEQSRAVLVYVFDFHEPGYGVCRATEIRDMR
jgi:hypothetical protein